MVGILGGKSSIARPISQTTMWDALHWSIPVMQEASCSMGLINKGWQRKSQGMRTVGRPIIQKYHAGQTVPYRQKYVVQFPSRPLSSHV